MDVPRGEYPSVDKTLSLLTTTLMNARRNVTQIYRGASTAFYEGMKYIAKNMHEAENIVVIVVPRVLEMIYGRTMHTWYRGKERRQKS